MAYLEWIFPARNLHLWVIFHGYVSHNQMVYSTVICLSSSSSSHQASAWSPPRPKDEDGCPYQLTPRVPRAETEEFGDPPSQS